MAEAADEAGVGEGQGAREVERGDRQGDRHLERIGRAEGEREAGGAERPEPAAASGALGRTRVARQAGAVEAQRELERGLGQRLTLVSPDGAEVEIERVGVEGRQRPAEAIGDEVRGEALDAPLGAVVVRAHPDDDAVDHQRPAAAQEEVVERVVAAERGDPEALDLEVVTERVALYNNSGAGFVTSSGPVQLMGMFSGGRAMDAGTSPMASAVMDAFRVAPAGLAEEKLVPLIRVIPDAIRIEIERQLKAAEFFSGTPDGNFGPDVRQALADWVDAMGPLPDVDPSDAGGTTAPVAAGPLPMELVDRVRDRVFTAAMKKEMTDAERTAVIAQINALAAYGDLPARWVLVRNYHQSGAIRQGVSPAEVTRYGLDILVTRPEGVEKPDFEFIFDVTAMMDEGTIDQFGAALVNAVRDDERLRDPLTLGAIMQQMIFAPGACDSVLKAIETLKIADGGDDGCGEVARSAIIAFAKSSGAANVDSAARQAAAQTLAELDAGAN